MRLTILGCGTVSWQTRRACSCYHVTAGNTALILDCGSGAMKRFEDAALDYLELDAVLLSHTAHPDHVADLSMLLFSLNYTVRSADFFVRQAPLSIFGPAGTAAFYHHLGVIHPPVVPEAFSIAVHECADQDALVGGVRVVTRRVSHGDTPALGYRLEHDGSVLAYSGDTGPCDALLELFHLADVAICECSVEAGRVNITGHLDASQAGQIAGAAGVRRLLVTHQYPGFRLETVESQIRENYRGMLLFADDLDHFEL